MPSPSRSRSAVPALVVLAIGSLVAVSASKAIVAQQAPASSQRPAATFRSSVDLVTVNVVVRDRNGNVVRGLTRDDFTVTEDNRPQSISTFDFEEIETQALEAAPASIPTVLGSVGRAPVAPASVPETKPAIDMHGRRLIAMLFDLSSMQPEEVLRSANSAREYIEKRLTPADMVAIATLSTTLQIALDFTGDREILLQTLDRLSGVEGMGFEETAAADATDESATAFAADDSEFSLFNTDRRLQAIQALTEAMPARLAVAVPLASFCALRFGEMSELRRKDIDLQAGILRIRRGVVRVGRQGYIVGHQSRPPASATSRSRLT